MERRSAALKAMAGYNVSQRRACRLVGVDPKTVRRERIPDCPEIRHGCGRSRRNAVGLGIGGSA